MFLAGEALVLVLIDAAHMRRTFEATVQVVGPGVVGAANHALHFTRLLHQLHATVTAHVVEHLDQAFAVTHQQQGQPHEVHRLDVAVARQVAGETDARPVATEHVIALQIEITLLGIKLIGQAMGLVDRSQDSLKGVCRDEAGRGRGSHYCFLLLARKEMHGRSGLLHDGEFRQEGEASTNDFYCTY
ncbi:hypothetical protein D3C75_827370 [compost metagenome]